MQLKKPIAMNVYDAAKERIAYTFDHFEKIFVSFSGGKDSTAMLHLVMEEAQKRNRKVGCMLIDFEAQYKHTADHAREMFDRCAEWLDVHWICLPIKLRNAVSNFEPSWCEWDPERRADWVREMPEGVISDTGFFPFFESRM